MAKPKRKAARSSKAAGDVQAALDKAKAYLMQCNITANVANPDLSLGELEKQFDLAGARVTYAQEQRDHWTQEAFRRRREFNRIVVEYKKRKHGFTDEEIRDLPKVSTAAWSYAK